MNTTDIETPSAFPQSDLDDITVMVKGEERLQLDQGHPVSKSIFIETEALLEQFIAFVVASGMNLERTFDARTILGERLRTDSRFRYHASRALAFMAKTGLFEITCINPDEPETNRYKIVFDKPHHR